MTIRSARALEGTMGKSKRKRIQDLENMKIDEEGKLVEVKPEEPKPKKPLIMQTSHRR